MKTKWYITLCALLLSGVSVAQTSLKQFKIEGSLTGTQPDSVKLNYAGPANKRIVIAAPVINGAFILKGVINGPSTASISFSGKNMHVESESKNRNNYKFIVIGPYDMKINGEASALDALRLTGSKDQDAYEAFNNYLKPFNEKSSALRIELKAETDLSKKELLKQQIEGVEAENKKATYRYFLSHPNEFVTEYYMNFYVALYSLDSVKRVYNLFTPEQKKSIYGKNIGDVISGVEATSPGQMAIDFKTIDVNGKAISLFDFKGKYVLLDFWASWCAPCRQSHPHLIEWYNAYKDKGLEIIGVASDDGFEAKWKKAIEQDGIGIWHHVLAGADSKKTSKDALDLTAKYGVTALPTKLIIGPDGKILARDVGDGMKIGEELQKIFNN